MKWKPQLKQSESAYRKIQGEIQRGYQRDAEFG